MDRIEQAQKINECQSSITKAQWASRPYTEIPFGDTTPVDYSLAYRVCLRTKSEAECEFIFQKSIKEFCTDRIANQWVTGIVKPLPELPSEDDTLYIRRRAEAKAQSVQVEIANKKIELKNKQLLLKQEAIKLIPAPPIPAVPAPVLAALDLLKKARTSVQDAKLKAKNELAEQKKKAEQERQSATRGNIEKATTSYSYPLVPPNL